MLHEVIYMYMYMLHEVIYMYMQHLACPKIDNIHSPSLVLEIFALAERCVIAACQPEIWNKGTDNYRAHVHVW